MNFKEWWIDDVTQRTCAPWDHEELGFQTLKWPDCEKVIHVVDYEAYRLAVAGLKHACEIICGEFCSKGHHGVCNDARESLKILGEA